MNEIVNIYTTSSLILIAFVFIIRATDDFCQNGEKQSPVDFEETISSPVDGMVSYDRYNDSITLIVHSYKNITIISAQNVTINVTTSASENLPAYIFHHMRFGCAEHARADYRNKYFELHLVHYSSEQESYDVAKTVPKGLFIVAVLFKGGGNKNVAMCHIWELLHNTTYKLKNITLSEFLPAELNYFIYDGSLITDNCNEVVTWMVAEKAIGIHNEQFEKLQAEVNGTCRSYQKLNGRAVYSVQFSSGELFCIPSLILMSILIAFLIGRVYCM